MTFGDHLLVQTCYIGVVSSHLVELLQVVTDRKKLQLKRKAEAEAEQRREDEALAALDNSTASATTAFPSSERVAQTC